MTSKNSNPTNKHFWHYIGSYPIIPATRKLVLRTRCACYYIFPTVIAKLQFAYILVCSANKKQYVIAIWCSPYGPNMLNEDWRQWDSESDMVLEAAEQLLQHGCDNI